MRVYIFKDIVRKAGNILANSRDNHLRGLFSLWNQSDRRSFWRVHSYSLISACLYETQLQCRVNLIKLTLLDIDRQNSYQAVMACCLFEHFLTFRNIIDRPPITRDADFPFSDCNHCFTCLPLSLTSSVTYNSLLTWSDVRYWPAMMSDSAASDSRFVQIVS